jgi:hypothetical protein
MHVSELTFLKFSILLELYKSQFSFKSNQSILLKKKLQRTQEQVLPYVLAHKINYLVLTDGSLVSSPSVIPTRNLLKKSHNLLLKNYISIKFSRGDYL